jgi:hypothetical protein
MPAIGLRCGTDGVVAIPAEGLAERAVQLRESSAKTLLTAAVGVRKLDPLERQERQARSPAAGQHARNPQDLSGSQCREPGGFRSKHCFVLRPCTLEKHRPVLSIEPISRTMITARHRACRAHGAAEHAGQLGQGFGRQAHARQFSRCAPAPPPIHRPRCATGALASARPIH